MQYLRLVLRYFSYIITTVVALIYLAASFAPMIRPSRVEFVALLGLFFPLLLVAMVLVTLYWLLRLRWRMALLLSLVYALSWQSLSGYFPINRAAGSERLAEYEGKRRPIKILSFNVAAFAFRGHSAASPNRSLLYVKGCGADIVCLQEALLTEWGVKFSQVKAYLEAKYPYIDFVQAQGGGSNLMLLSRYPIKRSQRLDITSAANGAAAFVIDLDGREVQVINLHLESFRLNKLYAKKYLDLAKQGEPAELTTAMLRKMGPVFLAHEEQADIIHKYIDSVGRERTIVCGDFNDTPVSYSVRHIGQGLTNTYTEAGNGAGFSFRSRFFRVRIDHIFVGSAFRPIWTEVDQSARGSDHFPIYSYVELL